MATTPRIGMIGDGNVGGALSRGLQRAGYDVQTTGKDPDRVREIAQDADVIVLAVPYGERENALEEMGELSGKTVIDVTNAMGSDQSFAHDLTRSGAEEVQDWAPGAQVVKAFNTVFSQNMDKGKVAGEPLSLFLAGDDLKAKRQVQELGRALGFEPVDAGPLANARWLEALGYFNIQLGYGQKLGSGIGFRLVGGPARKDTRRKGANPDVARGRKPTRRPAPARRAAARTPRSR